MLSRHALSFYASSSGLQADLVKGDNESNIFTVWNTKWNNIAVDNAAESCSRIVS